jgi:hypothetical protein
MKHELNVEHRFFVISGIRLRSFKHRLPSFFV